MFEVLFPIMYLYWCIILEDFYLFVVLFITGFIYCFYIGFSITFFSFYNVFGIADFCIVSNEKLFIILNKCNTFGMAFVYTIVSR